MDDDEAIDIFYVADPPTPKPTFETFRRRNGEILEIRLVGQSPLWGHLLWSAGKILANYLDEHPELVRYKNVLEFGAAAALPSLIAALNGATSVSVTDYPDPDLIQNIQHNIDRHSLQNAHAEGFIWGRDTHDLLNRVTGKYDLIILSDLIFNHQAHGDLLKSCRECLSTDVDAQILVFFTHHRPHLADKDNAFFELAPQYGFSVEKIVEDRAEANVMFDADGGSREVRSTVHGYRLRRV